MTLNYFKSEEERIQIGLVGQHPGTDEYAALLRDYQNLCFVAVNSIDAAERLSFVEENKAAYTPANVTEFPAPIETPSPDQEPVTETEQEMERETETSYTLDEVKAEFIDAAKAGVNVGGIIKTVGFDRLSNVPPEKYGVLMAELTKVRA